MEIVSSLSALPNSCRADRDNPVCILIYKLASPFTFVVSLDTDLASSDLGSKD